MLQRQDSMTEAPRASKAEFETFFGFVENHYELVKSAMDSVSYRPGFLTIEEKSSGVCIETMKSTIVNNIASESKLSPKLREAILTFFSEPAVMNGHKVSMRKNDFDRLDEYMNLLPNDATMTIVIAINKTSFASSYWELPQTETEVAEDDEEFRFKVSLKKVAVVSSSEKENDDGHKVRPPFDWEFSLEGTVDVRFVDTTKFTQLEVKFDRNFKQKTTFSPSAITALAKPRQAIYDAAEKDEGEYQPILIPKDPEVRDILAKVVHSNILFRAYSPDEQRAIVDAFQNVTVARNEIVIQQGESGAYFYVVANGELEILLEADGLEVPIGSLLGKGDYFGELALMYNTPRAASVKAKSGCDLWRIDRVTYRRIVTHYHNETLTENSSFLSNVVLHGKRMGDILDEHEKSKVVSQLDMEEFSDGSIIVRQGNTGDSFYIIKSGSVAVWQQQSVDSVPTWVQITTLGKGDFFGEKALLHEDVRSASCIAVGEVRCLSINRHDFIGMLGEWKDMITDSARQSLMAEQGKDIDPVEESKKAFLKSMTIEDLTTLSVLGQGAFGRVKLAQHKTTGETYALKCQSKKAIVRNRIEDTVINEMRLMRMLDHERIGKLFCALQDTRNIYFVLELLQGGEFFTYLQKVGRLSEAKAVFYAASVVSAFTALHAKKIAYRDLKPENMVLDSKGFVKIVDLGLAKQILSGKTWTMCGTPDYLAPEIILNEGHDYAVDYWALGVLIYEMVTGWPPFYADEPMKTYEKIVACSISFPVYITRQMSDVVSKLLATQPGRRLGNLKGGINDIMKHKWFGSFDWAGLDDLTIAVPYVPTIKDATDTSNFESYDDEKLPDECNWTADLS
jgi:CRP-like cAMP-binding protein/tRNA A-37 threonylcarbamoyl transferase component Bud32